MMYNFINIIKKKDLIINKTIHSEKIVHQLYYFVNMWYQLII